jgi:hypothetical protein
LQWRSQDVGDDRNVQHLPRKTVGSEQNQPRKEANSGIASKAVEIRIPKPLGAHIMPPYSLGAGHRAIGYSVCPARFCLALVLSFLAILLSLSFGIGMFTLDIVYGKYVIFILIFRGSLQRVELSLKEVLNFGF